jgi:hypothetical protein
MLLEMSTSTTGLKQNVEAAAEKSGHPTQITEVEIESSMSDDDPESGATLASKKMQKKSAAFYLSFVSLNIMTFIVSLDATTLSVAIPVRLVPLASSRI